MKKFLLLVATVSMLAALPSQADPFFTATGTVLAGDPATRAVGGATEQLSPCNGSIDPDVPAGLAQGVDGYWIQLPEGSAGRTATLTANEPNDVDGWFYDEGCGLMPSPYTLATTDPVPNGDEQGVIPEGAAWVVVDLYVGAAATFTFSIA